MTMTVFRPRPRYETIVRTKRRTTRFLAFAAKQATQPVVVSITMASTNLLGPIGTTPLDAPAAWNTSIFTVSLTPEPEEVVFTEATVTVLQPGFASVTGAAVFNVMAYDIDAFVLINEVTVDLSTDPFSAVQIGTDTLIDAAGFGLTFFDVRTISPRRVSSISRLFGGVTMYVPQGGTYSEIFGPLIDDAGALVETAIAAVPADDDLTVTLLVDAVDADQSADAAVTHVGSGMYRITKAIGASAALGAWGVLLTWDNGIDSVQRFAGSIQVIPASWADPLSAVVSGYQGATAGGRLRMISPGSRG